MFHAINIYPVLFSAQVLTKSQLAAYYHWETLFAIFVKITATTQIITGCVGIVTVLEGNFNLRTPGNLHFRYMKLTIYMIKKGIKNNFLLLV